MRSIFSLRSPLPVALAGVVVVILFLLEMYWTAIVIGCTLSVVCFFYNLIWLYSKCNKLIGGVPQANYAYVVGFFTVMFGYLFLSGSFFLQNATVEYLGGLMLMCGLTFTVLGCKILFDRILRGASIG